MNSSDALSRSRYRERRLNNSTVMLTVVRVIIAMYRKYGNWGYRSSLTPEPVELILCTSDYVGHRTPHAQQGN